MQRMIQISDRNYSLSETPITVAQYKQFCEKTGTLMRAQPEPHHPNNPVTQVSWHEAVSYCSWLGEKYRLPTEDEFEHCCGDHVKATEAIAVFALEQIKPVKTKQPNKYGLYDMLGCIWEWQNSEYDSKGQRMLRVLRGGSWLYGADYCRSAFRDWREPSLRGYDLGFRVLSSTN